jgi:hypothetical protein
LLAGVIVAIAASILMSAQTMLYRRVPLEKSPEVLAKRARNILQSIGYSDPPVDTAMGFFQGTDFLRYIEEHDRSKTRWDNLEPGAFGFWYRGSPRPLEPHQMASNASRLGVVSVNDPAVDVSGMTLVRLDTLGHLTELVTVPPQVEKPSATASARD